MLKVPTSQGDVYFKTVIPEFAGEPARLAALASRFPDRIPQVVASDEAQGRWITRDFGGVSGWDLVGERDGCLTAFAGLQIGFVDHLDELEAAGFPVRTYDDIATDIDQVVTRDDLWHDPSLPRALSDDERQRFLRLGPVLADRCASLADGSFPLTVSHGDLELLNVVRAANGWVLHDWTCAAISHPFIDLACWVSDCDETEAAGAVAAYLDAWQPFGSAADLQRRWMLAKPVGGMCELLSSPTFWMRSNETSGSRSRRCSSDGRAG